MIKTQTLLAAALAMLMLNGALATTDSRPMDDGALTASEISVLRYMREEEKLARDTYLTLGRTWGQPIFNNIARSEQRHMDTLAALLARYGLEDPVTSDDVGVFTDPTLAGLYIELVEQGSSSSLEALYVGALIEEIDIIDLAAAIEETHPADIVLAYESLMAGSENHLRAFAGQIERQGLEYIAQAMDPAAVDAILGRTTGPFSINPGLNDAWYDPQTNGQGFFISVYPDLGQVFLAWFTFDAALPTTGETAVVGDPGHRWLTAFGPYQGNGADLTVEVTRGGLFTQAEPAVTQELGGTVTITFEDCSQAMIRYDLPAQGLSGTLPIQRLATDNVAACESWSSANN